MLSSTPFPHPPIALRERPPCTANRRAPTRGVTLIELMVTLVVLAIVLAIGAPALNTFIERQAVEGAAEQFAGDIRFARTEAMKRGQAVSICIRSETVANGVTSVACANTAGTRGYADGWLVFSDVDADGSFETADGDTTLRDQQTVSGQITSMIRSGSTLAYTLQSTGVMLGGSGNITITPKSGTSGKQVGCVIINFAGRARVETGKEKCSA